MAAENGKTFTEDEHLAVLADRVSKETATLTTELESLKSEKDELSNKLDVETAARATAEQEVTKLREEFETFKSGLEELREAAARKDERVAKVKEATAQLGEDFVKDEGRIQRIVAMDEASFEGYLVDLKATAPTGVPVVPRETAMSGAPAAPKTDSAARGLFLGRFAPVKEG